MHLHKYIRANAYRSKQHVVNSRGIQSTGNSHGPCALTGSVGHLLTLSLGLDRIWLATVAGAALPQNAWLWGCIVCGCAARVVGLTSHRTLNVANGALHLPCGVLRWVRFDARRCRCIRIAARIRDREGLAPVVGLLREASTSDITISLKDFFRRHF